MDATGEPVLTPAEIEQGWRLLEAATPGEWDTGSLFEENYLYAGQTHLACLASSDTSDHYLGDDSEAIANARFIAWAKNNLSALLVAYEAAVAENARLREGVDRMAANFCLNEADVAGFLSGGGA